MRAAYAFASSPHMLMIHLQFVSLIVVSNSPLLTSDSSARIQLNLACMPVLELEYCMSFIATIQNVTHSLSLRYSATEAYTRTAPYILAAPPCPVPSL